MVHEHHSREGWWDTVVGRSSSIQPNSRIQYKSDSRASKAQLMNDGSEHSSGDLRAKLCHLALMSFAQMSLRANVTQQLSPICTNFFHTSITLK